MEKDLDPDIIKTTQATLGKYVKRPPLSEKLLKKPPFRFLHDIITSVLKTTGFFEGLFEDEELISENVKDRDSKILFLNKVISVVGIATGKSISAKPSKIVAGQEPDKTNELLQCLADALDKKISSTEAVKKFKDGGKAAPPVDKKAKEPTKPAKKSNEVKKLTSKSTEKLTNAPKKTTNERSLTRADKDKSNTNKVKQKENTTVKSEVSVKKASQTKVSTKKQAVDKTSKQSNEILPVQEKINTNEVTDKHNEENLKKNDEYFDNVIDSENLKDNSLNDQEIVASLENDQPKNLDTSYTIAENDLNSTLSSQDLMEVEGEKPSDYHSLEKVPQENNTISRQSTFENHINDHYINREEIKHSDENAKGISKQNSVNDDIEVENKKKATNINSNDETIIQPVKLPSNTNIVRPLSVRPSSSRPGAPRLREKHDNIITENENLLVGKVNIIAENAPNEEEEDTSVIIVDQQPDPSLTSEDEPEQLQLSSNQHGHLVQQILNSQKEFSQVAGKTEIEWQFGAQKAREALNQEIEQLRFNIQGLSRVANPLGKLLDHVQEDVEVMRQELQQWTKSYDEASKELHKQKTISEDSLLPLRTKLKQLNLEIDEKREKINDLKIVIHKNTIRIEKLLLSGDVQ